MIQEIHNVTATQTHTYECLSFTVMASARSTGLIASASVFHDGNPYCCVLYSCFSHLSNTAHTRPWVILSSKSYEVPGIVERKFWGQKRQLTVYTKHTCININNCILLLNFIEAEDKSALDSEEAVFNNM